MKKLFWLLLSITILNAQDYKNLFDPNSNYLERGSFSVAFFTGEGSSEIQSDYDHYNKIGFRTVAVNPRLILPGSVLFIPKFVGVQLPNGTYHDGYFFAHALISNPQNRSIKLFIDKNKPNPFIQKKPKDVNLFVVSGWMIKLMAILATIGEFHVVALIGVGFAIGVFLGLGIPPSACYILSAVIVIPPMTRIGINPWVAHFFLFFVAVISEYSPPTSLVAAVASRISGASFMKTMMVTLQISLPFFFLTFAIFNWDTL